MLDFCSRNYRICLPAAVMLYSSSKFHHANQLKKYVKSKLQSIRNLSWRICLGTTIETFVCFQQLATLTCVLALMFQGKGLSLTFAAVCCRIRWSTTSWYSVNHHLGSHALSQLSLCFPMQRVLQGQPCGFYFSSAYYLTTVLVGPC